MFVIDRSSIAFFLIACFLFLDRLNPFGVDISAALRVCLIFAAVFIGMDRKFLYLLMVLSFYPALVSLINMDVDGLIDAVRVSSPIFSFAFFYKIFTGGNDAVKYQDKESTLLKFSWLILIFAIFANLGIFPDFGTLDMSFYGFDQQGAPHGFQTLHQASITTSLVATLLLISCSVIDLNKSWTNAVMGGALVVYAFLLFVRTGVVCFLLAIFYYYFKNRKWLILLCFAFVMLMVFQIPEIQRRAFDLRQGVELSDSRSDDIGSGRVLIFSMYKDYFLHLDIGSMVFGSGRERVLDKIEYIYGWRVLPHNQLIEYLVCYGIIGFCFFVSGILLIARFIRAELSLSLARVFQIFLFVPIVLQGGFLSIEYSFLLALYCSENKKLPIRKY